MTTASAEEKSPFRIAAILPFSGDLANIGLAFRNGIEMALESLPPHVRSRYQVEYEDDGLQPSKSVSAFQKLIHSGKIDLLLNFSSNTSKALAPLAERNKVPFLAVASDPTISRGKKFTYNFFASSDELGQLATSAARKRGIKSFARATTIQDGAIAYKHAFDRAAKGNPVATIDEEFSPEITDFRAFLTKVRSRPETEALFVLLLPGRAGIFAKQARELGLQRNRCTTSVLPAPLIIA